MVDSYVMLVTKITFHNNNKDELDGESTLPQPMVSFGSKLFFFFFSAAQSVKFIWCHLEMKQTFRSIRHACSLLQIWFVIEEKEVTNIPLPHPPPPPKKKKSQQLYQFTVT